MANRKFKGFSLAELLIALLVISIVLAAAIPTMTRKGKGSEQIWKWSVDATPTSVANQNETNTFRTNSAYFGTGANQSVFIGSKHDPLSYAKVDEYFPALNLEERKLDFTTLGDKLSLLKVGLKVECPEDNTSDELTHFVNSHISFYNEPRVTSTENETEYVGRIVMDQNNMAMGLGSMQSTLSEYTQSDTKEYITVKGNTSLGHYSLFWNTIGMHNTAIGNQTLLRNQKGSKNTAIGSRACNGLDGSYNICIGAEAGATRNEGEKNNIEDFKEIRDSEDRENINYKLVIAADRETVGYNSGDEKPYQYRGGRPLIEGISSYNGNTLKKVIPYANNVALASHQQLDDYPSAQEKQLVINSRYFIVRPYNGEANHAFKITSDFYSRPVAAWLSLPSGEETHSNFAYTCYDKEATGYCNELQPTNSRMELRLFEPSEKSNIANKSINFTVQQPYKITSANTIDYLDEVGIYSGFFNRMQDPTREDETKVFHFSNPKDISLNDQLSFKFAQNKSGTEVVSILPRDYINTDKEETVYDFIINKPAEVAHKTVNLYFNNNKENPDVTFIAQDPDSESEKLFSPLAISSEDTSFSTPNRTDAIKIDDDSFLISAFPELNAEGVATAPTFDTFKVNKYGVIITGDPDYNAFRVNEYGVTITGAPDYDAFRVNENGIAFYNNSKQNNLIMQISNNGTDVYMPALLLNTNYSRSGSTGGHLVSTIRDLDIRVGALEEPIWSSSDIRLKNVSGDSTAGLKEINALEVKNYTYKNDKDKTPHVGVIAQQLQKVFPNSVFEDKDGYLKIRTEEIFYAMVNSIKELSAKVQDLTAKIVGLDKRITELEKQNAELKKKNEEFEKRLEKLEKAIK